jgi:hypothetical protein
VGSVVAVTVGGILFKSFLAKASTSSAVAQGPTINFNVPAAPESVIQMQENPSQGQISNNNPGRLESLISKTTSSVRDNMQSVKDSSKSLLTENLNHSVNNIGDKTKEGLITGGKYVGGGYAVGKGIQKTPELITTLGKMTIKIIKAIRG